ncbi:hypothetical protein SAMN06265338_103202 [Rhodoblastus acidophilus]|uniref:Uncharacterized protein n=1 Tax=Rhodoblastus acidophilus TaxID=1074 RepID=A0A212RAW8_RHOAC|nr:hypothetical protein [Rhodoblastus acidophilus]PPQ39359.1 hypothetical protein CKO16_06285 [Rhodoblastus acidophilus]RAI22431.1 hypothetical protein CH337_05480 [Rhodoblastus acidophilus]SNB69340.1 hypothetical protein SAMN06265338_103202 [Rhodoblastus acidophilus]
MWLVERMRASSAWCVTRDRGVTIAAVGDMETCFRIARRLNAAEAGDDLPIDVAARMSGDLQLAA